MPTRSRQLRGRRCTHSLAARAAQLRAGFTLLEAMLAISLTAVAGGALLVGVSAAVNATSDAIDKTIAQGLARQLLDEAVGKRYSHGGISPYATSLGPSPSESIGPGRSRYTDVGDFNNVATTPPKDLWGVALGADDGVGGSRYSALQGSSAFATWRQEVKVYYVRNTDLSQKTTTGQTSDYRAIEVKIYKNDSRRGLVLLASLRRVVAYIPNP